MPSISGCLARLVVKLLMWAAALAVALWAFLAALNPWALHIGGRSTPFLIWHGTGTLLAKGGKTYPLYVWFAPGQPGGFTSGGRRDGKTVSARLTGDGWLCVAPGSVERMDLSGTMYGGYTSDANSVLEFRLLEWRSAFSNRLPNRGFIDLGGTWHGPELVLDRPNEQSLRFKSGLFIDSAVVTLRWGSYADFEAACNGSRQSPTAH